MKKFIIENPVNSGNTQTDNAVGNPERSLKSRNVQRLTRRGVGPSGPKRRRPGKGLWFEGEVCLICKISDRPHHAKGLCKYCHKKEWHKNNPKGRARHNAKYYKIHKKEIAVKVKDYYISKKEYIKTRTKNWYYTTAYDGNMLKALDRDNWECQNPNCPKTTLRLVVHHIDGNGVSACEKPDHTLSNLITLCNSCHSKLHSGHDIVWTIPKGIEVHKRTDTE